MILLFCSILLVFVLLEQFSFKWLCLNNKSQLVMYVLSHGKRGGAFSVKFVSIILSIILLRYVQDNQRPQIYIQKCTKSFFRRGLYQHYFPPTFFFFLVRWYYFQNTVLLAGEILWFIIKKEYKKSTWRRNRWLVNKRGMCVTFCSAFGISYESWRFHTKVERWSNGLVVKALDFQSKSPVFKTTGSLQGRLSLSSFRGQ